MRRKSPGFQLVPLVVTLAASGFGCSGGCSSPFSPLPAPLPPSQIVEGGVQVRVTPSGLSTVSTVVHDVVNSTLGAQGVCIPGAKHLDPGTALPWVDICYHTNDCTGGQMGCTLTASVNSASLTPVSETTLRADVNINAQSAVPIHLYYTPFGVQVDVATCTMVATVNHSHIVADVGVGIDPGSAELTLHLQHVDVLDIDPDISSPDCSITAAILDAVSSIAFDLFSTDLGNLIVNLITPTLDGAIQGILPRPLGLDGVLDIGSLLASIAPGAQAQVEVHGVPGGYARLENGGLSVGMNVGFNADRDPTTRTPTTSSQPSLCMPPWPAPDLAAPPSSLPHTPRGTFALGPEGAFTGAPEIPGDFVVGLSRTALDLAGHHVAAAGALCLTLGTDQIPQLNLGTIGLLVPSLAALGRGNEPVQIVLRPTTPITFDYGEGTPASPFVMAHLKDFEIDFYAFIFERYVRAFTLSATFDVGVNLGFMVDRNGQPFLSPAIGGLDSKKIVVKAENTQFLHESSAQIETLVPTLIEFLLPLLSSRLPDLPVPSLEGFTLGSLVLAHTHTDADEFLSISGSLVRSQASKRADLPRATTQAQVVRVTTPSPDAIRAGHLPEIALALGGTAPGGDPLEWQWSLDGGMWHVFSGEPSPVLSERAFAIQGKHTILVRARAAGRYETTDLDGVALDVDIDSMAPNIDVGSAAFVGDELVAEAIDAVSPEDALEYALSSPGAGDPATDWTRNLGHFSRAAVNGLVSGGSVKLYVRDEVGNVATALLDLGIMPEVPQAQGATGCAVGGGPGGLLFVLVAWLLATRRRTLVLLGFLGACSASGLGPAPGTPDAPTGSHPGGGDGGTVGGADGGIVGSGFCRVDDDCEAGCEAGQVPSCTVDRHCQCLDDLLVGNVGLYSSLATSGSGAGWISAYDATYGDLVAAPAPASGRVADIAWEFVDGVPADPVAVEGSHVRGGVKSAGDDVGLYTSAALAQTGDPLIAYYDATHASLRFASRSAGVWHIHTIETGAPGTRDIGRYASISLDGAGRPGIAYLALVQDGSASHSEVRFAQAQKAIPAQASDWSLATVESKPMTTPITGFDDLPDALGLFISTARTASGAPVLAYYDRIAGTLRLAQNQGGSWQTPVTLDGGDGSDVGWYPSLAVSADGTVRVAYVDAARQNLLMTSFPGGSPEVIDDGYRIDGTTGDGEPLPVFHRVGDNSAIIWTASVAAVVYQDATTQDLLLAEPGTPWTHTKIAGSDTPYRGAFGFYLAARMAGANLIMSTYAIDQQTSDQWVEVFRRPMP